MISTYDYLCIPFLCQALAQLYVIDGQYEKAFSIYADVSVTDAHGRFIHKQPTLEFHILDEMFMLNDSENHGFASLFCVVRSIWLPFFFFFFFSL